MTAATGGLTAVAAVDSSLMSLRLGMISPLQVSPSRKKACKYVFSLLKNKTATLE
jgi:hypothetical protein